MRRMSRKLVGLITLSLALSLVPLSAQVARYSLDGNAQDSSGNNLHGTLIGDVDFVPGVVGLAARFDGQGDRIKIGSAVPYDDEFSFSGWLQLSGPSQGGWVLVFAKTPSCNNAMQSLGFYEAMEAIHVDVSDYSNPWYINVPAPLEQGRWYHLASTAKPGEVRVFLDGQLVAEQSLSGPTDHNCFVEYSIGGMPAGFLGGPYSVNGKIDEVAVFDRALSIEEIVELSEAPQGPSAIYHLDEGAGTTALDASGFGNDGMLVGGASYVSDGYQGSALRFGGDSEVVLPDTLFHDYDSTVYVRAWFRQTMPIADHLAGAILRRRGHYNDLELAVWRGELRGVLAAGSPTVGSSVYGGEIPFGVWTKAAVWYDGTDLRIYLNDLEVGSEPGGFLPNWSIVPHCDNGWVHGCYAGTSLGHRPNRQRRELAQLSRRY